MKYIFVSTVEIKLPSPFLKKKKRQNIIHLLFLQKEMRSPFLKAFRIPVIFDESVKDGRFLNRVLEGLVQTHYQTSCP